MIQLLRKKQHFYPNLEKIFLKLLSTYLILNRQFQIQTEDLVLKFLMVYF